MPRPRMNRHSKGKPAPKDTPAESIPADSVPLNNQATATGGEIGKDANSAVAEKPAEVKATEPVVPDKTATTGGDSQQDTETIVVSTPQEPAKASKLRKSDSHLTDKAQSEKSVKSNRFSFQSLASKGIQNTKSAFTKSPKKGGAVLKEVDEMLAEKNVNIESSALHNFVKGVFGSGNLKQDDKEGEKENTAEDEPMAEAMAETDAEIESVLSEENTGDNGDFNAQIAPDVADEPLRLTPYSSQPGTPRPSSPVIPADQRLMTPTPVPAPRKEPAYLSTKKRTHSDMAEDTISVKTAKTVESQKASNKLQKKPKKDVTPPVSAAPVAAKATTTNKFLKSKLGTMRSTVNLKMKASTDALKKVKDSVVDPKRRSARISEAHSALGEDEIKKDSDALIEQSNPNCNICVVNLRPVTGGDCAFITLPKAIQAMSPAEVEKTILSGCSKHSIAVTGLFSNETATKTIRFAFVSDAKAAIGRTIKFSKQSLKITSTPPIGTFFQKLFYTVARTGVLSASELAVAITAGFPKETHFQLFQRTTGGGSVFTSDFTIAFWHSKLTEKTLALPVSDGRVLELNLRAAKVSDCKECPKDEKDAKDAPVCGCYRIVEERPFKHSLELEHFETNSDVDMHDSFDGKNGMDPEISGMLSDSEENVFEETMEATSA